MLLFGCSTCYHQYLVSLVDLRSAIMRRFRASSLTLFH
jgi:hypothetical protein